MIIMKTNIIADSAQNNEDAPNNDYDQRGGEPNSVNLSLEEDINKGYEFTAPPTGGFEGELSIVAPDMYSTTSIQVRGLNQLIELIVNKDISPGVFENDGRRNKRNFKSSHSVFLDVEDGTTAEGLQEQLNVLDCKYAIFTSRNNMKIKNLGTPSEQPAIPRLRAVIPINRPTNSAEEHETVMNWIQSKFPCNDRTTQDAARLYFKCSGILSSRHVGPLLDVDSIIAKGKVVAKSLPSNTNNNIPKTDKGRLSYATQNFLTRGVSPGGWNAAIYKATKDFQEQGYTFEEAIERISKMSNPYYSGTLDATDIRTIESAFKNEPKYAQRAVEVYCDSEVDGLIHSFLLILFNGIPSFNEMDKKVYIGTEYLKDEHLSMLRTSLDNYVDKANSTLRKSDKSIQKIPKDRILDTLITFSKKNSFHPFKRYVESNPWNGENHIKYLFDTLVIADEFQIYKEHYESCFKKFFLALVNKVYNPGARNNVLVFHGGQGIGKSRFIEKLLPIDGAFSEGAVDPDRPDNIAYHFEKVLWHISEFDSVTNRKDAAALKDYVDKSVATVRRPYDKFATTGFSQLSFIASVNSNDFLRDATGSRRFIPMSLTKINVDHNVDMQQVYAQCKDLLNSGEQFWLTKAEDEVQVIINSNFSSDSLADVVIENIEQGAESDWLSVAELKEKSANSLSMSGIRNISTSELRNKLERLGFKGRANGKGAKKFNIRIKCKPAIPPISNYQQARS